MISYLFFLILLALVNDTTPHRYGQAPASINLYGSCYDGATGVDLKVAVFAEINGHTTRIGEGDEKGFLNLTVPVNSKSISFIYDGYQSIELPTHFIGSFSTRARFRLVLPMSANGTTEQEIPTRAVFAFTDVDTTDVEYEMKRERDLSLVLEIKSPIRQKIGSIPPSFPPDQYVLVASSKNGQWFYDEAFTIKDGLNFMEIHKKSHLSHPHPPAPNGVANNDAKTAPAANTVHLTYGTCWDAATGVDLKSTVYSVIDGKKVRLGESNAAGIINLNIPITVKTLLFESEGYESVQTPVYFIGAFRELSTFMLSIPVNLKGQDPSKKLNQTIFCLPHNHQKDIEYELLSPKNRSWLTNFTILINAGRSFNTPPNFNTPPSSDQPFGDCMLVAKTKAGQVLMEKEIVTKEGLNIVDIHIEPTIEKAVNATKTPEKPTVTFDKGIVYFDKSSYVLKDEANPTLDSAAAYLLSSPESKVLVVGYTDNIGSREPNITLSEYRARVVTSYLQKKGVSTSQVVTKWEGPDYQVKVGDGSKNRRVVVQVIR